VNAFFRSQLSYFDCKNRLNSMVKNYSSLLLAKYLIPSILANVFNVTRKMRQNDWEGVIGIARALGEIVAGLDDTLRKRSLIQRGRKIKDSYLLDEGLIVPMNLARLSQRSSGFG
jgi:hypothetical protein